VICLAEGNPPAALAAVADVLDGTAPVLGYVTVMEAHLLAGLAHRELGDQRAASRAAERALALAESDRLILPFAMTGSAGLLEALPRHQTAHAALLADILDVLHGVPPAARQQSPRISAASTPSSVSGTGPRPCGAPGSCGCWRRPAGRASPAVTGSW
jgi:LuxR family maltose regulon positive regulatory protein